MQYHLRNIIRNLGLKNELGVGVNLKAFECKHRNVNVIDSTSRNEKHEVNMMINANCCKKCSDELKMMVLTSQWL